MSLMMIRALTFLLVALISVHGIRAFQLQEAGQRTAQSSGRSMAPSSSATTSSPVKKRVTFREYLDEQIDSGYIDSDLCDVLVGVARSCAEVAGRLKTHTLDFHNPNDAVIASVNVQGEQQKGMDVVANDIFISNLNSVPAVAAMASEEEEEVIYGENTAVGTATSDARTLYEIAFDPLDGSGNLDVNLPTGSIFGIADCETDGEHFSRPGSALVSAGYALYSTSTELVVSFGTDHPDRVLGFTLVDTKNNNKNNKNNSNNNDRPEDNFVLSRKQIRCPSHGPYYSLNEAREPDWPHGLRRWIFDAKRGQTTTGKTYSSRYVCSLCADLHRALLEGGWAGNPRPHLRLLYEAAPLAFLIDAAGGRGSDGTRNLLEIVPHGLHDRVCVFLGSRDDIDDLESYKDVQQIQPKRYEA